MVYDSRAKAILLFGGRNEPTYVSDFRRNDTWKDAAGPDAADGGP